MFSQFKRLFKHSAIYAIGSVAQSAVAFLLIPLYTNYLVPASYGRLEIVNTFGSIILMLITFGFSSALMKTYFRDAHNTEERKKLVGTMFIFVIPIAFAILAVLLLIAPQLSRWLLGDAQFASLFQILLSTTFFTIFMNMAFALLRVEERSKKYTVLFLLRFGIVLGLNFYFIMGLKLDAAGILWANLISFALVALSLIPDVIKAASWSFSRFYLRKLWGFGMAIIPASIAVWVMDLSDRYFIEIFRDPTEVGIYALGYKIGMIVDVLIVAPFQLAWPTMYFDVSKRNDAQQIYSKVLTYFVLIGTFVALILGVLAPEGVKLIADPAYWGAAQVVMLVAISYVFYGMHFVLAPGIHITNNTKYYPWLIVVPAIANLVLNYFIVPVYGMLGAAVTTFACYIFVCVLTYLMAQKFYPIKYEWKKMWAIFGLAALIYSLSLFIGVGNIWLSVLIKCGLLALFLVVLYSLGFLKRSEWSKFKLLFVRTKKPDRVQSGN